MSAPDDPFGEMRSPVVPLAHPDEAAAQRARVIARMEGVQQSVVRKRTIRARSRYAAIASAVLAAAGAAWLVLRPLGAAPDDRGPVLQSASGSTSVLRGERALRGPAARVPLFEADVIQSGEGAALRLRSGARLDLRAETHARIVADRTSTEEVALEAGRLDVSVPKLAPGGTLIVRTADAAVTVRGTRFTVAHSRGCAAPPCTAVKVLEGRVEVEHAGTVLLLHGGDEWPLTTRAATLEPAPGTAGEQPRAAPPAAPRARDRVGAPPHHSTLAEENALLERAMAARRAGDHREARELLEEHLRAFPRSPMSRNAALEHLRALRSAGSAEAARAAARRYLARYPEGMGSEEARHIATSAAESAVPPRAP